MNGKKKILITGGTGYIGSSLVKKLILEDVFDITLLVRDLEITNKFFKNNVNYIKYSNIDELIVDIQKLEPNIVIHLAAYSSSSDTPSEMQKLIESNIIFTSHLLAALDNIKVDLFLNTSSFSEYHNNDFTISPTYFYSATKSSARYMIEYFSKKNDFRFINAVLFTVYGKKANNKKIIDYAIESLNSKEPIAMSEGNQLLDFIHIEDIVSLYINIIKNYKKLHISKIDYFIGTGECYSIKELVKVLEEITSKKANILWGAYKSRKLDTIKACADITLAKTDLHYKPTISLEKGLKKYIKEVLNEKPIS